MTDTYSMSTCPMSAACKGMSGKPMSGIMFAIPALIFIAIGVAVIIAPQILAWLVGIILIAMGGAVFLIGQFMRKFASRP